MQGNQGDNGIYSPVPKFRAFALPSGVNRLLPYCTLNSVAKLPMLRYTLKDATASVLTSWTYGEALDVGNPGDYPVLNQGSPCLGYHDDSAKFLMDEGGPFYNADNNTFGNVSTDDIVVRCLVKFNFVDGWTGSSTVLKKLLTDGYSLSFSHSTNLLSFVVNDADGVVTTQSAALDFDAWYWIEVYADRSENCQIYVNGFASGLAVDISARTATLDSASAFTVGEGNMNLAYVDMFHGAAWLDTATQTVHAWNDFCRVCGVYPDVFGTSNVDTTDVSPSADRAFPAYLEKYNQTTGKIELYYVGDTWMRVCSKQNTDAGGIIRGFFSEKESENLIVESEDFSATWTLLGTA